MTVTLDRSVKEFIGAPRQLFINGQWADSASGETFETPNPATGETLARVAEGGAEDIDRAVRAARRAFEEGPWSRMTPSERGRVIWRIGDLILEHLDELAQLESLDNGKPFAVAQAADVPLAADLFHYMAGWATKIEGNTGIRVVPVARDPGLVVDDRRSRARKTVEERALTDVRAPDHGHERQLRFPR